MAPVSAHLLHPPTTETQRQDSVKLTIVVHTRLHLISVEGPVPTEKKSSPEEKDIEDVIGESNDFEDTFYLCDPGKPRTAAFRLILSSSVSFSTLLRTRNP